MADTDQSAAAAPALYLYEVLYRGTPAGVVDFHVVLAQDTKDAFGQTSTSLSPAMTPAQAKEHGFDVGAVITGLNANLAAEADAAKAAQATAETERDAAKAEAAAARAKLQAVSEALAAAAATLSQPTA